MFKTIEKKINNCAKQKQKKTEKIIAFKITTKKKKQFNVLNISLS